MLDQQSIKSGIISLSKFPPADEFDGDVPGDEISPENADNAACFETSYTWLPKSILKEAAPNGGKRQSYIFIHDGPTASMLFAPPSVIARRVTKPPFYKGLAPYKLEKSNIVLFPEWYFLFMKRISKMSSELYAYCRYYHTSFSDCFDGEEDDVVRVVDETIRQYSESIKANLGSSFDKEKGDVFTRDYFEKDFIPKIIKNADWSLWVIRKNQLLSFAKKGKLQPLLDFLMAFCTPEESIWLQILEACLPFEIEENNRVFVYEKWLFYQKQTGPLAKRVQGFQDALKSENHFPIGESPSDAPAISKKRPVSGDENVDSENGQSDLKVQKTSSE